MGLDLAGAQAALRNVLMGDSCKITHDAEATEDDTLDLDQLDLVPPGRPGTDAPTLYEGICAFSTKADDRSASREGGVDTYRPRYVAKLPITAPIIPTGAVFEVTDCPNDPLAVGRTFVVIDSPVKTLALARKLVMVEVRPGPTV